MIPTLADKLIATAIGDGYYEGALREALSFTWIGPLERDMLCRYLRGATHPTDHVLLQSLAHAVQQVETAVAHG